MEHPPPIMKIPLGPPFTKGDIIPPFGKACLPVGRGGWEGFYKPIFQLILIMVTPLTLSPHHPIRVFDLYNFVERIFDDPHRSPFQQLRDEFSHYLLRNHDFDSKPVALEKV